MLKSVFDNQDELLQEMVAFYAPQGIDLDPTFGNGCFYKKLKKPRIWGDIKSHAGFGLLDARKLPFGSGTIDSIMFDPPFLPGESPKKTGIINNRFGWFKTIKDVWKMYGDSLQELERVLMAGGVLFFKCQDVCNSGKQWWSHVWIINKATELGLQLEDLFVLTVKHRLTDRRWKTQRHARKFHSYFLVFRKVK